MNIINVSNQIELLSALSVSSGDTTIRLAGGNYGNLTFDGTGPSLINSSTSVIFESADASNPGVISGLYLNSANNITFDGIVFDYVSPSGAHVAVKPFVIENSNSVTIKNSDFNGDLAKGTGGPDDGYGTGIALAVNNSANIKVEENKFSDFYKAVVSNNATNISVSHNDISRMSSDGINFMGSQGVLVEKNHIHNFLSDANTTAHPDMIQFFTRGATRPTKDVIIRENVLDSETGAYSHSIMIKSEVGLSMEYENILIENNFIHNAFLHGITTNHINGLTIKNNTVLHNPDSDVDGSNQYIPQILIGNSVKNATVSDNIAHKISGSNWTGSNNLFVQNTDPTSPNYYGNIFVNGLVGGTGSLDDFVAVSGGIIELLNVGSKFTRPTDQTIEPTDIPIVRPTEYPTIENDTPILRPTEYPIDPADRPIDENGAPIAHNDLARTSTDRAVSFDVLGNDVDVDDDNLTIHSVGSPNHGSVHIGADGKLVYQPKLGYVGVDTFLYEVSDGKGGFDRGKVTVEVTSAAETLNHIPQASDDEMSIVGSKKVAGNVLVNDVDVDGDSLLATLLGNPKNGIATLAADGRFTYQAAPGFTGTDSLRYSVDDGKGGTDTAFVYFVVVDDSSMVEMPIVPLIELSSMSDNTRFFNSVADFVSALEGDDHVRTTGGNDVIDAGAGDDTVRSGNGDDTLLGGDGNDKLFGGNGTDVLVGGSGQDILKGNYKVLAPDKFVFSSLDIGYIDTILDFGVEEGDQIDLISLFGGLDITSSNLKNYIQIEPMNNGSILSIDQTGSGREFVHLVEINGVRGLDVADLVTSDSILIA